MPHPCIGERESVLRTSRSSEPRRASTVGREGTRTPRSVVLSLSRGRYLLTLVGQEEGPRDGARRFVRERPATPTKGILPFKDPEACRERRDEPSLSPLSPAVRHVGRAIRHSSLIHDQWHFDCCCLRGSIRVPRMRRTQ